MKELESLKTMPLVKVSELGVHPLKKKSEYAICPQCKCSMPKYYVNKEGSSVVLKKDAVGIRYNFKSVCGYFCSMDCAAIFANNIVSEVIEDATINKYSL